MSMVQFNLLPDVKMNYIKAKRTKRSVLVGATSVIAVCLFVVGVLASIVMVGQKVRLSQLDSSINKLSSQLKSKPDINKLLTLQNQVEAVGNLHSGKPVVSRLFIYIAQVTPLNTTISNLSVNFSDDSPTMNITGQAKSLEDLNKFIDTLKFTTMTTDEEGTETGEKPFSQVVLSSFGRDDQGASFVISLNYDPRIFSSAETKLKMVVPKITTTRSDTEAPSDLFDETITPLTDTPEEDGETND